MGQFSLLDSSENQQKYLHYDAHTIENLEIFEVSGSQSGFEKGSLIDYLDYTKTNVGKRLLKRWIETPLTNVEEITQRQDSIEDLINSSAIAEEF